MRGPPIVMLKESWHGQPRRISSMVYNSVLTLAWKPYELAMIVGGAVLLGSALLFLYILWKTHQQSSAEAEENLAVDYAEPMEPMVGLPAVPNGFRAWNIAILLPMLLNFGYPIAQFFLTKTYDATAWGY
jgi:cytochrome c oxidase subunit 1